MSQDLRDCSISLLMTQKWEELQRVGGTEQTKHCLSCTFESGECLKVAGLSPVWFGALTPHPCLSKAPQASGACRGSFKPCWHLAIAVAFQKFQFYRVLGISIKRLKRNQNHDPISCASSHPNDDKANDIHLASANQVSHLRGSWRSILWRVSKTVFLSKVSCRFPVWEGTIIGGCEGDEGMLVLAAHVKYLRLIIGNKPKDGPKLNLKTAAVKKVRRRTLLTSSLRQNKYN